MILFALYCTNVNKSSPSTVLNLIQEINASRRINILNLISVKIGNLLQFITVITAMTRLGLCCVLFESLHFITVVTAMMRLGLCCDVIYILLHFITVVVIMTGLELLVFRHVQQFFSIS